MTSRRSKNSLEKLNPYQIHPDIVRFPAVVFMKAGSHSGDTLREIIDFKIDEQRKTGRFYWGYSGSLCHPKRVRDFIEESKRRNLEVSLVLSSTTSEYSPPYFRRVREISVDSKTWNPIPKHVNLWNCKYALVAKGLRRIDAKIRLGDYIVATGRSRGRPLDGFIRGRVSKACAFLNSTHRHHKISSSAPSVQYQAAIVPPYSVYAR